MCIRDRDSEPARSAAPAPGARRRLRPTEQHAPKTLPDRLDKLTREVAMLNEALASPTLYAKDPALFKRASERLTAAQGELAAAEDRWLELEMKQAEIDG